VIQLLGILFGNQTQSSDGKIHGPDPLARAREAVNTDEACRLARSACVPSEESTGVTLSSCWRRRRLTPATPGATCISCGRRARLGMGWVVAGHVCLVAGYKVLRCHIKYRMKCLNINKKINYRIRQ
jgi:hypothetical protein